MASAVPEFDPREVVLHPQDYFRREVRLAVAGAAFALGERASA